MSGGGGGGPDGAPDFYYRYLVETGQEESQMGSELFNFYKYGTFNSPGIGQEAVQGAAENLVTKTGGETSEINIGPGFPTTTFRTPTRFSVSGSDQAYKTREEALAAAQEMVQSNPEKYNIETYSGTQSSYADMERAQIESNLSVIPEETALRLGQLESQQEILPYQTDLTKEQIQQKLETAPLAGQADRTALSDTISKIEQRAPVRQEFYNQALRGVNETERMNQAQAEVAQQMNARKKALANNIRRTGATPGGGRMSALYGDLSNQTARNIAGARTAARTQAEQEEFQRLGSALSI